MFATVCTGPLPPATGSESEKIRENQKKIRKMEKFYRMFVSVCTVSYHLPLAFDLISGELIGGSL